MLKKLLMWWLVIALLILTVRAVIALAEPLNPPKTVHPGAVYWHTDSASVVSVGWIDRFADTVVVFQSLVKTKRGSLPDGILFVPISQIDSIVGLAPVQTAHMKPPNRG